MSSHLRHLALIGATLLAACSSAAPPEPTIPPELEKPYPWRLAPDPGTTDPDLRADWFRHHAVDEDTVAFVRSHDPALAEIRLELERILKDVEGASIITLATDPGGSRLRPPEAVEEDILRLWKASTQDWADGRRGRFARGISFADARQQVFEAAPGDPRALLDIAVLFVTVPTPNALAAVVGERRAAWEDRLIEPDDDAAAQAPGGGDRTARIIVETRGRPVELLFEVQP